MTAMERRKHGTLKPLNFELFWVQSRVLGKNYIPWKYTKS
jgi:hypothetical protein